MSGINAARKDLNRLQEQRLNLIKANSEGTWQEYWVSEIENNLQMVTAWIAYKQGRRDEALHILRATADREDSTEWDPVMPGRLISARQLLGEMLLDANHPLQALQAFEAALKVEPGRSGASTGRRGPQNYLAIRPRPRRFTRSWLARPHPQTSNNVPP
jgi:hypothetical protein